MCKASKYASGPIANFEIRVILIPLVNFLISALLGGPLFSVFGSVSVSVCLSVCLQKQKILPLFVT